LYGSTQNATTGIYGTTSTLWWATLLISVYPTVHSHPKMQSPQPQPQQQQRHPCGTADLRSANHNKEGNNSKVMGTMKRGRRQCHKHDVKRTGLIQQRCRIDDPLLRKRCLQQWRRKLLLADPAYKATRRDSYDYRT
jgi:hypothetical protein